MFIPKGTVCFQNMRVLNFDPEVFGRNGAEFDPARFLDEQGQVVKTPYLHNRAGKQASKCARSHWSVGLTNCTDL